jgi:hypothetical protein
MRYPKLLLPLILILVASCGSTGGSNGAGSGAGNDAVGNEPPKVASIGGRRVKVQWRNLNPKYGTTRYGLVNYSSPEKAFLNQPQYGNFKAASDEDMALLLEGFRQSDFFDYAIAGTDVNSYRQGDGHHVVSLTLEDDTWSLVSSPAANSKNPEVARIARDLKLAVMDVYNRTYHPRVVEGDERLLTIPPPRIKGR